MKEYILRQDDAGRDTEQRRLALLQRYQDAPTIRCFETIGVAEGWRCLDAGAGGGSISRWLAQRVGTTGSVLSVDLDTHLLEEGSNLTVRQLDLRTDPLPEAEFDLVHTRLVLTHIAEREEVLDKLVRAARPGGWVVVGDIDFSSVRLNRDDEVFDRVIDAYGVVSRKAGGNPEIGPSVPAMLERRGLKGVEGDVFRTYQRCGGAVSGILGLTFERLREQVLASGITVDELEHLHNALADPELGVHSPTIWTVWGRR